MCVALQVMGVGVRYFTNYENWCALLYKLWKLVCVTLQIMNVGVRYFTNYEYRRAVFYKFVKIGIPQRFNLK